MNDAITVMWDRQVKEYLRKKQRIFASLAQPILFLIAFNFGIGGMYSQAGNGDYLQYLIPGIIGMTILFSAVMNGMSLIWDKQFGFLKETLVAPVSRTSLLFGRCLGGATTSTFQGLIVLGLSFVFGFRITNWFYFPLALIVMFVIALMFSILGTSLASKFDDMHSFPMVINFLVMPMFFLSGALFPLENFPPVIEIIARINPFSYCVDLLKFSFIQVSEFGVLLDVSVIIGLLIILGIIGTSLFNKLEP